MIGKRRDDLLDRRARKGEISKEKLGQYIECLELALVVAGGIVVVGLIVEDGPELWRSLLTWTWPPRAAVGDLLVTAGVFSEVLIAFVIAGIARRVDAYAEADTAKALERAAKAQEEAGLANERTSQLESGNIALRTDLEKAKAEAAKAQLELRRYIDQVDRKAGARRLDREKFLEQLTNKPTGTAFVTYKPEDVEAFQFATAISAMLREAGWQAPSPMPFGGRNPRRPTAIPFEVTHGGAFGSGVTIKCKNPHPIGENSAVGALINALTIATEGRGGVEVAGNPDCREDWAEIIIGQKK
jgi:hypothetical protein